MGLPRPSTGPSQHLAARACVVSSRVVGDRALDGLARLGAASRGVWTRGQAVAVTSRGVVQSQVRRGLWQVVWPGVYADAGQDLDTDQRARAAVLASGGDGPPFLGPDGQRSCAAVASGRTAARLHRLPLIDDRDPATGADEHLLEDVTVRTAAGPLRIVRHGEQRVLRRTAQRLVPSEVGRRSSGLWVTTPVRTLVDLAGLLSPEALVCAVDSALHRHLVDEDQLAAAVREHAWSPGVVALRGGAARGDRRAESPAETLARLALLPVLPGLVPQHRLRDASGRVLARFDLGDEALRLAVEADGKAAHAGSVMAAKDRQRDRVSERHGWRTERVTWFELRCRRRAFVARVQEVAAERSPSLVRR